MYLRSVRLLLQLFAVATLLLYYVTEVQSMSIPDIVTSLTSKRNLDSRSNQVEEGNLKLLSNLLDKLRSKKSVTLTGEDVGDGQDEEDLKRYVGLKSRPQKQRAQSFDEWKKMFVKKSSGPVAGSEAEAQKNVVQLKDRDYFQAIGLSPGGYDSSYSNSWNRYGNDDY